MKFVLSWSLHRSVSVLVPVVPFLESSPLVRDFRPESVGIARALGQARAKAGQGELYLSNKGVSQPVPGKSKIHPYTFLVISLLSRKAFTSVPYLSLGKF